MELITQPERTIILELNKRMVSKILTFHREGLYKVNFN